MYTPYTRVSRLLYDVGYRAARMPWELGSRRELVSLVGGWQLRPGRVLDLGCGTGDNAVFLARRGFDVTGVDFAPAALAKARRKAEAARVAVRFLEDDLTQLHRAADVARTEGPFDLLLDYGSLDDLRSPDRDRYACAVVPLARPGTRFLLWCFEWIPRWWERLIPLSGCMAPGEVRARFARHFELEVVASSGPPDMRRFIPGYAAYLMTRREM